MNTHGILPHRRLLSLIVAGAILLIFGATRSADAQSGALTGTLSVLHGDPERVPGVAASSARPRPKTQYLFTDDSGRHRSLLIDPALIDRAGGPKALDGKRVSVTLAAAPATAAAAPSRVQSIQQVSVPSVALIDPIAPDIKGRQNFAVIMCRFSDQTDENPASKEYFESILAAERPGLDHYWREVSYNAINLTGSQVFDWKNLPSPRKDYLYSDNGVITADTAKLLTDCPAVHASVDFTQFQGIAIIFNQMLDGSAYGSRRQLTLDGQTRMWAVAWIGPGGMSQSTMAHEMGHGFGLPHSSGPYEETYDSVWDVMSRGELCPDIFDRPQDFPYGCIGFHTIAAHKDHLGWLPSARRMTVATGSTTVPLRSLSENCGSCIQMIKIPIGGNPRTYYTVERRESSGYDSGMIWNGVIIHKVDEREEENNARVVDKDNNGDVSDTGAVWEIGESFTDAANGVHISIGAVNGNGSRAVTVTRFPEVTVADASVVEGNSGTRNLQFTIKLSHAPGLGIRLNYATSGSSAASGTDFQARSGVLNISGSSTTYTIDVPVIGDLVREGDEQFTLKLSNPLNAIIKDATAIGTIINDDFPPPPPSCPPLTPDCQIK